MSTCVCPAIPKEKYDSLVKLFVNDKSWDLLKLQDMYNAGNTLKDIMEVIPFRNDECTRSKRCCGVCTRQCHSRCMQDCLNRLYMWRMMVATTPEDRVPLAIRMIVKQDFETLYDLSWCVGDIVSRNANAELKKYMVDNNMYPGENPYKLDYSPRVDIDEKTGKRKVDPVSGAIHYLDWPKSGLCPFCLPKVIIDRGKRKYGYVANASNP